MQGIDAALRKRGYPPVEVRGADFRGARRGVKGWHHVRNRLARARRVIRPSRGEGARRVARGWDEQIAFGFTLGNMRPDPGTGLNALEKQSDRGDERRTERCECERSRLLRLLYACGFTASAAGRERTTSAFL
jgi:hypothetical protein